MIRLDRSSEFRAEATHFCTSRLQGLFNAATSGRGSCTLASTNYGSADYTIVQTAFHEAGHATAARSFGLWAQIHLVSPARGRCYHIAAPLLQEERCIALAGAVTELLAVYGFWQADDALCRSVPGYLSSTDCAHAGAFGSTDILQCRRHVSTQWSEICREACEVINCHVAAWELE